MPVKGDTRLLEILMQNLLENAWKFTVDRADARIEVGSDDRALFCMAAKEAGTGYPIRVASDGLEVLRRLRADPLYRNIVVFVLTRSDLESDRSEASR